ncbi:Nuclear transcription factor Y subunit B-8, partial [Ananas comosus]
GSPAMADAPASPGGGGSHESGGDGSPRSNVREQDRFLPIANLSRIMKKGIPANGKIAKEAKETVQECVSEFISFVTSEASDKCQREKRKTINGDDLLWAMATLGFEDYIEPLKLYLQKYREGDSKLGAKGGDGSIKKDGGVLLLGGAQQGSSTQGVNSESTRTLQSRHELHATSVTGDGSLFAEGAELLGHSYQARPDPTSMAFASGSPLYSCSRNLVG